jgi:RNA polymerase sigma-70 factor (ECF subfamily)
MTNPEDNLTTLLQQIRHGDGVARDKFSNVVYDELKKIARGYMARERRNHTLQATAIVNEVYIELFGKTPIEFQDRGHFYKVAALQMRRLLKDYGRARSGPERRRDLAVWVPEELLVGSDASAANLVIHDLLDRMERENPAAVEVVELKFFTGLTNQEVADFLKVSVITVRRRWASALAWLVRNLKGGQSAGPNQLSGDAGAPPE